MEIKYTKGDALQPIGGGSKTIVHVCNDLGGWGAGFVIAISKKWKDPETAYRSRCARGEGHLGAIDFVAVRKEITVANMICQRGYSKPGKPAIDYKYLETCLLQVRAFCEKNGDSVHMPRIGCGLAGGRWEEVEQVIKNVFRYSNIQVTVYDL